MRGRLTRKHVNFEMGDGRIVRPFETFGLRLSTWDITPPKPKIFRVSIDGGDGTLDMTEWAGQIRYEDRTITLVFRRYSGGNDSGFRLILGRRLRLRFEDDAQHYYEGRCEEIKASDNGFVTDYTVTLTCKPYRLTDQISSVQETIPAGEEIEIALRALCMPVVPTLTVTGGDVTVTIDDDTATYTEGTHTLASLVLTDQPMTVIVGSTEGSTVRFTWKDGDF